MDIAAIDAEERALVLKSFDGDDAWFLGAHLRQLAKERGVAVSIEVQKTGTTLFLHLMPGTTPDLLHWMRRKIALAMRFERSSYAKAQEFAARKELFEAFGLDLASYAPSGGAVPIRVAGAGVVGIVALSGIRQDMEHEMAVLGLKALKALQDGAADIPNATPTAR